MIELAQHIENLLLENDCVIVPDLGGFITHYAPACKIAEENRFLPPSRIIGFNPQLKMNDGMLVQSYMAVYGTSFSDASKRVERDVKQLQEVLHENGKYDLPNVGELRYTIHDTYDFIPYDHKITSPYLYGLDGFEMSELPALRDLYVNKTDTTAHTSPARRARKRLEIRFRRSYLTNVAAMIAILVLFFLLSTPVKNTEVMEENYAQLLPEDLFEKIERQSLAITPVRQPQASQVKQSAHNVSIPQKKEVVPVAIKEVKVKQQAPATRPITQKEKSTKTASKPSAPSTPPVPESNPQTDSHIIGQYHIIVASMGTEKDAKDLARQLNDKGYKQARALIGNGKMRVSIQSFVTQEEAYKNLQKIRQDKAYQSAWVLKQ